MSPWNFLPVDSACGQWWIRTSTSYYRLDFDNGVVGRLECTMERLPSDLPVPGHERAELRRDGALVPVLAFLEPVRVGQPMRVMIMLRDDGVPTMRTTTVVTEIGRLCNGADHLAWDEIVSEYEEGTGDGTSGMDPNLRRGRGGDGVGGES